MEANRRLVRVRIWSWEKKGRGKPDLRGSGDRRRLHKGDRVRYEWVVGQGGWWLCRAGNYQWEEYEACWTDGKGRDGKRRAGR